jgi:hypothetical protein
MAALQTAFDFAAPRSLASEDTSARAARGASALEATLAAELGAAVRVRFTDNTRTMLSCRRRADCTQVRLHHMFADAPAAVLSCLARYLRAGERDAAQTLSRYIDSRRATIRRRPEHAPRVRARGRHHDLRAIYDELNLHYFEGAVDVRIGWSRMGRPAGRRRKRRSIKLGSYREHDALVRVHPVLDQHWVPRFFVAYVVYHEMLHHVLGIGTRQGRRRMHTPEFRRRERAFAAHVEATAWERQHLARLLSG